MATSASTTTEPVTPRKPLLRRAHRAVPPGLWYGLAALGLALLIVLAELIVHVRASAPRDQIAVVERELRLNTLQPNERVLRSVQIFRRSGTDYFRQTRGLLVLTDRRLIYLGAPPRDITGATDAPPTFDEHEFPIDSMVQIRPSFALLGFARALRIEAPPRRDAVGSASEDELTLGVPSAQWQKAKLLMAAWDGRQQKLAGLGVWAGRVRAARAEVQKMLANYRAQPVYHVVRPGDAVGSIADWYQVSPDSIRVLNHLNGNTIKVGQRLLIRGGTAK
jgi:LysM domain